MNWIWEAQKLQNILKVYVRWDQILWRPISFSTDVLMYSSFILRPKYYLVRRSPPEFHTGIFVRFPENWMNMWPTPHKIHLLYRHFYSQEGNCYSEQYITYNDLPVVHDAVSRTVAPVPVGESKDLRDVFQYYRVKFNLWSVIFIFSRLSINLYLWKI
jgi:hypothetical protein